MLKAGFFLNDSAMRHAAAATYLTLNGIYSMLSKFRSDDVACHMQLSSIYMSTFLQLASDYRQGL